MVAMCHASSGSTQEYDNKRQDTRCRASLEVTFRKEKVYMEKKPRIYIRRCVGRVSRLKIKIIHTGFPLLQTRENVCMWELYYSPISSTKFHLIHNKSSDYCSLLGQNKRKSDKNSSLYNPVYTHRQFGIQAFPHEEVYIYRYSKFVSLDSPRVCSYTYIQHTCFILKIPLRQRNNEDFEFEDQPTKAIYTYIYTRGFISLTRGNYCAFDIY